MNRNSASLTMSIKHARWLAVALLAFAGVASAGDVLMYRAGDRPDPGAMAAILSRPVKMRSIRMLPDTTADASGAQATAGAADAAPAAATGAETKSAAAAPAQPAKVLSANASEPAPASADSFAMPVPFAFDSASILPAATAHLEALAAAIKLTSPDVHVLIEGHTDSIGSDEYNRALSLRRAEAVKNYLAARGISGARLHVVGMGKSMPLDPSNPAAAENRRVQFRALAESERMAGSPPRHS